MSLLISNQFIPTYFDDAHNTFKNIPMRLTIFSVIFIIFIGCSNKNEIKTSFYPGENWTDNNGININAHGGGILFHKNKYYWYGQHMVEGKIGNTAQIGVHVYSSTDLYNWVDEGIALEVVENDSTHDIAKGCILERPKVIYNKSTKKFVMWFHLELLNMGYDHAKSGVAIEDNPTGHFKYIRSYRPDAGYWPINVQEFHKLPVADSVRDKYCGGKGCLPTHVDSLNILGRDFGLGQMARDMNLFVDDDGKAYHIYSSEENSTIHISQLTDDYLSYSGIFARFFMNRYMEAPTILKTSEGKYYFIGSDCTGWAPNDARSAVANNIFGPWTELGNPCMGNNSSKTFRSQSTYILPIDGKKDAFIFMADRWIPDNPIDGKYVWLPIIFEENRLILEWKEKWNLNIFE